jgi:ADP-ribosylglycohydrolase
VDALGSLMEFRGPEDIRRQYQDSVRELTDGGYLNRIAGQPTDDSKMALMLAWMLVDQGTYNAEEAKKGYIY